MTKNKIFLMIVFAIIIVVLTSLGISYNKKSKEKNLLTTKLEEVKETFENIVISEMSSEEEHSFNDLKIKFNEAFTARNIEDSKSILDEGINLENSVKSRIEKEKIEKAKLAEEKLKQEEELKKIQEEKNTAKLEENSQETSLNIINSSNNAQITKEESKPIAKIGNTSVAASSNQLISVVSTGGSTAELVLWQKDSNGTWYEYDSMFARLGESGMKYASSVYEMDLSTPTGVYSLTEAFGVAANPGTSLPYRVLDGSEYWVDDETSSYYNTMQFGEANGRWKSAEHLTDYQNAYKYVLVIDYNRYPVIPGKSSAIFLHVDVGIPTLGCVAVAQSKMQEILTWLNPSSSPKIMLAFSYDELYKY